MYKNDDEIEIACEVMHTTERAYKIDAGTGEEVWIPKSQVTDMCEDNGKVISLFIPFWLAEEKGLMGTNG